VTRAGQRWATLGALLLGMAAGVPAGAQDPGQDFYRNRTIRILVNATGGGFDVSARTLARHLSRHIPGNPAVVVETMSGAGGLVAANHLYRVAKPDGLTLAHFSGDLLLGEVLGRPGIEFDARRFQYIGTGSNEHIACAFSRASGITSLDRWTSARTPVKLGGTAPGANGDNATRILKAVLGLPIQLVSGYRGTAAIRLAVDSGELAGACFSWGSMRTGWQHAIEAGEVVVVLQLAARPLADLPAVPLVTELARTDDAKRLVATTILRAGGLARPYAAPPATPKDRVETLRRAFLATLRDPEYLAEAGKAKIEVHPTRGEEVERLVADLFTLDLATITRLRAILFD
jgi:tripartite-type tricarboxylate transporter receptor subunit TctC